VSCDERKDIHPAVVAASFSVAVHVEKGIPAQERAERSDMASIAGPAHLGMLSHARAGGKMPKGWGMTAGERRRMLAVLRIGVTRAVDNRPE
jgi:hypothetical protein